MTEYTLHDCSGTVVHGLSKADAGENLAQFMDNQFSWEEDDGCLTLMCDGRMVGSSYKDNREEAERECWEEFADAWMVNEHDRFSQDALSLQTNDNYWFNVNALTEDLEGEIWDTFRLVSVSPNPVNLRYTTGGYDVDLIADPAEPRASLLVTAGGVKILEVRETWRWDGIAPADVTRTTFFEHPQVPGNPTEWLRSLAVTAELAARQHGVEVREDDE